MHLVFKVFSFHSLRGSSGVKFSLAARGGKYLGKTFSRSSVIPQSIVGYTISIYNGRLFNRVIISPGMVGFKFGEFSQTRTLKHKKSVKKRC
jgi:small subunit ribosomal protein S19